MKKLIWMILPALLLLTLSSCRARPVDCVSALRSAAETGKRGTLYDFSGYLLPDDERSMLARLFCASAVPGEWAAVKQAAVLLGRGTDGYEIWLLEAKHPSELPRLEDLLRRRLELLQSPDVERFEVEKYDEYIAGATICTFDNCVCLLSTGDNEGFLQKLTEYSKQKE